MSDFKKTQSYFHQMLKKARRRVVLFCSDFDSFFWTDKISGFFNKSSLIDQLNQFLEKSRYVDTHLEIIYRANGKNEILPDKIKIPIKASIMPLTDINFTQPLNGLAEAFIVTDDKNTFISSNYETDSGIYAPNDPERAAFILNIFSQLVRHESEIAHNHPVKSHQIDLKRTPYFKENIKRIMDHHNHPIQAMRRSNPFVKKILSKENQ